MAALATESSVDEQVIQEIREDPEVAPRLHEALKLQELSEHPGWQYQAERFKNFRKGAALALARRLLAGAKLDPEQIAFERGYAAAIEDVFRWPERIERDLHRAAERAFERLAEGLSEEDGEYPYE